MAIQVLPMVVLIPLSMEMQVFLIENCTTSGCKFIYDTGVTTTSTANYGYNCYRMGVPTITIMSITGHTTESTFFNYIKVGKDEHAQTMMEHWNRIYSGEGK